jgi:pimeloyl-ACP methyl ester carboxylesterase
MSILQRSGRTLRFALAAAALVASAAVIAAVVPAATAANRHPNAPKPTIVLAHGAFADASGWSAVSFRLQREGYTVLAPANPLRGPLTDAAYLSSILDTIPGPVVLVGHSYGGFVLTNAATGHANVKALVYIAAFVPDAGDTVGGLTAMNPGSGLGPASLVFRPYPGGVDGYIDPAQFRRIFAGDLDRSVLAVPSGVPAWRTIPSWYMVASQDRTIPPATERFMARRANATTVEVASSHVAMISHPSETTRLIEQAAAATIGP